MIYATVWDNIYLRLQSKGEKLKLLLLPLLALTTTTVFANQSATERLEALQAQITEQSDINKAAKEAAFIDKIGSTERPLERGSLYSEIRAELNDYSLNEDEAGRDIYKTYSYNTFQFIGFLYGAGECQAVQTGEYDCKSGEEPYSNEERDQRVCRSLKYSVERLAEKVKDNPNRDDSHKIDILEALNQNYNCM